MVISYGYRNSCVATAIVMTDGIEFQEGGAQPDWQSELGIIISTHLQKSAPDMASA